MNYSNLPDHVRDFRLDTKFIESGVTVHVLNDHDAPPPAPKVTEKWKRIRRLGRGGNGQVLLQMCIEGRRRDTLRAAKQIPLHDDERRRYIGELSAIIKFSRDKYSNHFVKTLGWYESKNNLYIAMEYLPAGDLQSYLQNAPIPEGDARHITIQVLQGLAVMHEEDYAHRDIKPQNVLIQRCPTSAAPGPWWVKLADFGISKKLDETITHPGAGTASYMAPELFGRDVYANMNYKAADIWSLGAMTFFVLTRSSPPHYRDNPDGNFPRKALMDAHVSHEALAFVRTLMTPEPHERPDSSASSRHVWLRPLITGNLMILDTCSQSSNSSPHSRRSSLNEERGMTTEISQITDPQMAPQRSSITGVEGTTSEISRVAEVWNDFQSGPNTQCSTPLILKDSSTPLEAAANSQEVPAALLIKKGAYLEAKDEYGNTPLLRAAYQGDEAVARLLIETGANLEAKSQDDFTPLLYAVYKQHETVARLLIEKGADLEANNIVRNYFLNMSEGTPLIWAARRGNEAMARLLIGAGANLEANIRDYGTPLLSAVYQKHEGMIRLLIENGADLEAKTYRGVTPLLAAVSGHEAMARLLIEKGADLEAKNDRGATPLFLAAGSGHEAMARLLIEKGADLEAKNIVGYTPLLNTMYEGHEPVARLLIENGANLEAKNDWGATPLFLAAGRGHEAMARLLIEKGADLEAKGENAVTPLRSAVKNGHKAVAKLLVEKGARKGLRDRLFM